MRITGAIFDLDGTLIDSMGMWHSFSADFLAQYGITPDLEAEAELTAMTMKTSSAFIHKKYLPQYSAEEIEQMIKDMVYTQYAEVIPAKHGLKPFLFMLRNRGVRMCVATSSPRYLAEPVLKRLNLSHYFSVLLTADELNTTKESPDIYNRAHDILGTDKNTTYVFEDAVYAVRTAKNAGFKVVGVEDKWSAEDREEIVRLSDVYVKDYDDFRGMII